ALFVLYECDFGVDDFPKKLVFGTRENLELRLARELREKPVLFFADSEDAYAIVITANVVVVNLGGKGLEDWRWKGLQFVREIKLLNLMHEPAGFRVGNWR